MQTLTPIETVYKGYRFRSRLEARWAVFFDALGVPWEYEHEGFDLGPAGWYLPDFWLPDNSAWLEVKGQDPGRGSTEYRKAEQLAIASKLRVFMVVGDPLGNSVVKWESHNWGRGYECYSYVDHVTWCPACKTLGFAHSRPDCVSARVLQEGWTIRTAKQLARSVRFEHAEQIDTSLKRPHRRARLYLAGKIHVSQDDGQGQYESNDEWRDVLFHGVTDLNPGERLSKYHLYTYGGPELRKDHGMYSHGLAHECLDLVNRSDVMFTWLATADTHGTFAELGAGHVAKIPSFVAVASRELEHELWFARGLADAWVVTDNILTAFDVFEEWLAALP